MQGQLIDAGIAPLDLRVKRGKVAALRQLLQGTIQIIVQTQTVEEQLLALQPQGTAQLPQQALAVVTLTVQVRLQIQIARQLVCGV